MFSFFSRNFRILVNNALPPIIVYFMTLHNKKKKILTETTTTNNKKHSQVQGLSRCFQYYARLEGLRKSGVWQFVLCLPTDCSWHRMLQIRQFAFLSAPVTQGYCSDFSTWPPAAGGLTRTNLDTIKLPLAKTC